MRELHVFDLKKTLKKQLLKHHYQIAQYKNVMRNVIKKNTNLLIFSY